MEGSVVMGIYIGPISAYMWPRLLQCLGNRWAGDFKLGKGPQTKKAWAPLARLNNQKN